MTPASVAHRPKWSRIVETVDDGPLFGWRHVRAWWVCVCPACIAAVAAGGRAQTTTEADPT